MEGSDRAGVLQRAQAGQARAGLADLRRGRLQHALDDRANVGEAVAQAVAEEAVDLGAGEQAILGQVEAIEERHAESRIAVGDGPDRRRGARPHRGARVPDQAVERDPESGDAGRVLDDQPADGLGRAPARGVDADLLLLPGRRGGVLVLGGEPVEHARGVVRQRLANAPEHAGDRTPAGAARLREGLLTDLELERRAGRRRSSGRPASGPDRPGVRSEAASARVCAKRSGSSADARFEVPRQLPLAPLKLVARCRRRGPGPMLRDGPEPLLVAHGLGGAPVDRGLDRIDGRSSAGGLRLSRTCVRAPARPRSHRRCAARRAAPRAGPDGPARPAGSRGCRARRGPRSRAARARDARAIPWRSAKSLP